MDLQEREERAVRELTEVVCDHDLARQLATRAGFPASLLPPFSTPLVFWTRVFEQARRGVLYGGPWSIIEAAAELYPHNPAFEARIPTRSGDRAVREGGRPRRSGPLGRGRARKRATMALGLVASTGLGAWSWQASPAPTDDQRSIQATNVPGPKSESKGPSVPKVIVPPPREQPEDPFVPYAVQGKRVPHGPDALSEPWVLIEELLPAGSWSGEKGRISGRVRDNDSHPVAEVAVCAWLVDERAPVEARRSPTCQNANPRGRFEFAVVPGIYDVVAFAPEFLPLSTLERDEYPLAVVPGQHQRGIDLELERGGFELRGTVSNASAEPIERARVAAMGSVRTLAVTDAAGAFTLWVAEATPHVVAWTEGYTDSIEHGSTETSIDFVLGLESVLVGTVVDSAGRPVVGAQVRAGATDGRVDPRVPTDAQGRFMIRSLPGGTYQPSARTKDASGKAAKAMTIPAGEVGPEVEIRLRPEPADPGPPKEEAGEHGTKPPPPDDPPPPCRTVCRTKRIRATFAKKLRRCGRDGGIEVHAKFILESGALFQPEVIVTGSANADPKVEECARRHADALRLPRRREVASFRPVKVKI